VEQSERRAERSGAEGRKAWTLGSQSVGLEIWQGRLGEASLLEL